MIEDADLIPDDPQQILIRQAELNLRAIVERDFPVFGELLGMLATADLSTEVKQLGAVNAVQTIFAKLWAATENSACELRDGLGLEP